MFFLPVLLTELEMTLLTHVHHLICYIPEVFVYKIAVSPIATQLR